MKSILEITLTFFLMLIFASCAKVPEIKDGFSDDFNREALGEDIGAIPEGLYPGDYLKPVGRALAEQHGTELLDMKEEQWLPIVRAAALQSMLAMIEDDLAQLGIRHDVFFSERSLSEGARDEDLLVFLM